MHVMAHGFSKFLSSPFLPIPVSSYTAGPEQQRHQILMTQPALLL